MKKIYTSTALAFMAALFTFISARGQVSNWVPVGPIAFPPNISGQINGIARVSQIKFDPILSTRMYAVLPHSVFVSDDTATTWRIVPGTDDLPVGTGMASICIDRTNNNVLYLGTGDADYYSASSGVWKSTDGGLTFNISNTGMGNKLVREILMSPNDNNVLVAATNTGIYKTTNAGASWTLTSPNTRFTDICANVANGNILYAVSMDNQNVYSSTDFGNTWSVKTLGTLPSNGGRVSVTPANPNVIYVGYVGSNTTTAGGIIYRSVDGGATFTLQKGNNTPNLNGYTGASSGQGNYNWSIMADPLDANILYTCGHIVWKSVNGGVNFTQSQATWALILHTDEHQFLFNPNDPNQLFNANDGGVWINRNRLATNSWAPKSDGLEGTEFYSIGNSHLNKNLIGGGTQDNGEVFYKDGVWRTNRGGDFTTKYYFDNKNANKVYYIDQGTRRDLFNAPTGSQTSLGVPGLPGSTDLYATSYQNENIGFYAQSTTSTGTYLIYVTNNLQSATPSWNPLGGFTPSSQIMGMAISSIDANIMYVMTRDKKIMRSENVLNGATFTEVAPAPAPSGLPTNGGIDVFASGVVYMSSNGFVYRSADKGATWIPVGSGPVTTTLNGQLIKKIIADKDNAANEAVYVYTRQSVYYKDTTMTDWAYFAANLPTTPNLNGMDIFNDPASPSANVLRVGFYGRGLWQTTIPNSVGNLPIISITSPTVDTTVGESAAVQLTAAATDADGGISKVEFYRGEEKIGEDLEAPYEIITTALFSGPNTITTWVTDNTGNRIQSAPVTIFVNAVPAMGDSYVREGTLIDNNYGTLNGLELRNDGTNTKEVYLKFDLNQLSDQVGLAKLKLNISSAGAGVGNTSWEVYYVPSDDWTETGITGNNKPAATTKLNSIIGKTSGIAEWDITAQVSAEKAGDKILSLKIVSTVVAGSSNAIFHSREAVISSLKPQIVVKENAEVLPVVSITSPVNGANLVGPANITINADATDADGGILKVEFYNGDFKIGEDATAPYSYTWNAVPVGGYAFIAKAIDNSGAVGTSETVNLNMIHSCPGSAYLAPANLKVIYFDSEETAGENGAAVNAIDGKSSTIWHTNWSGVIPPPPPHEIQLALNGIYTVNSFRYLPRQDGGSNGRVGQYEIYVSLDSLSWGTPVATGTFANDANSKVVSFAAKDGRFVRFRAITEVSGQKYTTAAELNVGVCNPSPVVTITTPANNTSYSSPASITINANASDPDGSIAKVEFYSGITKIGGDDEAPYSFIWNNVPAGGYSITAKGIDNIGGSGLSAPVVVNVLAPCPGTALISQKGLKVIYFDSQEISGENAPATNAIDGNPNTIWHSKWAGGVAPLPHEIQLSLGGTYTVNTFKYLPRTGAGNGTVAQYEIYVSLDSLNWGSPVATGTFTGTYDEKVVSFEGKQGKFIRFRALSEKSGQQFTTAAELNVGVCDPLPALTIVSPANNASFPPPADITIDATVSNTVVSKVEFFEGTNKLGEDEEAPYSFTWNDVPMGEYNIIIKAISDRSTEIADTAFVIVKEIPPVINCPVDIIVLNDANACGAVVKFEATLMSGQGVITYSQNPGTLFPAGTTVVTATARNASNDSSACQFNVTVNDTQPPTISSPGDIVANPDPVGSGGAMVNLGVPVTNDNCGVLSVTNDAPDRFLTGETIVTWIVTDVNGNVDTTTQNIAVQNRPSTFGTVTLFAGGADGNDDNLRIDLRTELYVNDVLVGSGTLLNQAIKGSTLNTSQKYSVPMNIANVDYGPGDQVQLKVLARRVNGPSSFGVRLWHNADSTDNKSKGFSRVWKYTPESPAGNYFYLRNNFLLDPNTGNAATYASVTATGSFQLIGTWSTAAAPAMIVSARSEGTQLSVKEIEEEASNGLSAVAFPNPSSTSFSLRIASASKLPVDVRVFDVYGRVMQAFKMGTGTFDFGNGLAHGYYSVEVIQGNARKIIKLTKL